LKGGGQLAESIGVNIRRGKDEVTEVHVAVGISAEVLQRFADGAVSHAIRDDVHSLGTAVLSNEPQKPLKMGGDQVTFVSSLK
jgi:hypothetical protein